MPFGLMFRKAVLWHDGKQHVFHDLGKVQKAPEDFKWYLRCSAEDGVELVAAIDGTGPGIHRLTYEKTNCSGSFEVTNNSLAKAVVRLERQGGRVETLETSTGAVLEMVGR
jgi:hypothetical protein